MDSMVSPSECLRNKASLTNFTKPFSHCHITELISDLIYSEWGTLAWEGISGKKSTLNLRTEVDPGKGPWRASSQVQGEESKAPKY